MRSCRARNSSKRRRARRKEFAARSDRPAGSARHRAEAARPQHRWRSHSLRASERRDRSRKLCRNFYWCEDPSSAAPARLEDVLAPGCDFWPLAIARELEDAILHLRANEETIHTWIFRTEGDIANVRSYDALLLAHADHWLIREIRLYLKRVLKRIDVSSRSLFALDRARLVLPWHAARTRARRRSHLHAQRQARGR